MPQPRPGRQCRHHCPAGLSSTGTSKTLQHKVQVPQSRPGAGCETNSAGSSIAVAPPHGLVRELALLRALEFFVDCVIIATAGRGDQELLPFEPVDDAVFAEVDAPILARLSFQ